MTELMIMLDETVPDGAMVVSLYETGVEHNGMKEIGYDPIDLETLEAALNYVASQFPSGWYVEEGKILPVVRKTKPLKEIECLKCGKTACICKW